MCARLRAWGCASWRFLGLLWSYAWRSAIPSALVAAVASLLVWKFAHKSYAELVAFFIEVFATSCFAVAWSLRQADKEEAQLRREIESLHYALKNIEHSVDPVSRMRDEGWYFNPVGSWEPPALFPIIPAQSKEKNPDSEPRKRCFIRWPWLRRRDRPQ